MQDVFDDDGEEDMNEASPGAMANGISIVRSHEAEFALADGLNPGSFRGLIKGRRVGAILDNDIISDDEMRAVSTELANIEQWGQYDPAVVQPIVPRIGPALFSFYEFDEFGKAVIGEGYVEESSQAEAQEKRLPTVAMLKQRVKHRLEEASGCPVVGATHGDGRVRLHDGIIRRIDHGNGIHFDDVDLEWFGGLDHLPIVQISILICLEAPAAGGEVEVFDHRWDQRDEVHRDRVEYGFIESVVEGDRSIKIKPRPGSVYLFRTDNLHRVFPAEGGHRTTVSWFGGVTSTPATKFVVWG